MTLERTPKGFWRCRRVTNGEKCGHINPNRKRKCEVCERAKPPKRQPAHMAALELPYEYYVQITGGERCAICLRPRPKGEKRLHRDHCHKTGRARGLLCWPCNSRLSDRVTAEWLRAAADYLEKGI